MDESSHSFLNRQGQKKRILIVDDIRTDLHYMGKLIAGFGHETILAESAVSALELIDQKTDLIIADGLMPGMDGFEFVKSVRDNHESAHIPVIMVTSLSGRSDRIRAVEVGINDFVTKPVDKLELKVRVDSMLKMKDAQDRVRNYQKQLEHLVEKKTWALNSTLQKLQAVLNGMSDCVVSLGPQLEIIEVNQAFLKISGKTLDQLRGCPFSQLLVGKEQVDDFKALFSTFFSTCERDMAFPQWGRRAFSVLVTHMKDKGHILVMRDITEKKQADEQKARFLSILSHELRTPLNGIKGFSEVMLSDPESLPDEYKEYMAMINECGCQLEAIVEELLRFVQFYSAMDEPEEIDIRLDHLAGHVLESLSEKIQEKRIHTTVSVEGPPPLVHGKNEHLFEIVKQIIDNAIKFSPENSIIHLELITRSDTVEFICSDRGKGIPEREIERVFDSFFQVEDYNTRTLNGLGLGLTIARKIIELYKGSIRISNREKGGTRVQVSLPRPR
ncbi:MAG: response regulator [Proteobacteria bacterium]|nr:response regulator [Pseudomonadota bacterium]